MTLDDRRAFERGPVATRDRSIAGRARPSSGSERGRAGRRSLRLRTRIDVTELDERATLSTSDRTD